MRTRSKGTVARFADLRRREARLRRELSKAPLGELAGVVRPGGVGGSWGQGDKAWTLQIRLMAWRFEEGPVHETELVLRKRTSERTVRVMMDALSDFQVIRMRARVAPENLWGSPQALLIRLLKHPKDLELAAVAAQLRKPVRAKHPPFGILTLDRASGTMEGKASWLGRRIGLTLVPSTGGGIEPTLEHARRLFRAQKSWTKRAADRIAADLYQTWREGWREDGRAGLTKKQFTSRMQLTSITVEPEGTFSLWFDDGDLFGGHAIVVRGSLRDGVGEADIAG